MRLTAVVVQQLAQIRAKLKALTQQEEVLSDDLKDRMIELGIDEFAPRNLPMKLVKLEYEQGKEGFYEAMAKKAYKELYGPRWEMQLERDRDKWPKQKVIALRVIAGNENFRQPALEKAS